MKTRYACLLRGINVSGHKLMKMDRLRACLESLGFEDVKTYLQSGNAVFKATGVHQKDLPGKIAAQIAQDFGFSVPVLVLSTKEIDTAIQQNPFLAEEGVDPTTLHITFLARLPDQAALEKLASIKATPDRFRPIGKLIYLHCPQGYGNSKLSNTAIEKALKIEATTRNWKTVNELSRMLHD